MYVYLFREREREGVRECRSAGGREEGREEGREGGREGDGWMDAGREGG
jgi:hypothetical protein